MLKRTLAAFLFLSLVVSPLAFASDSPALHVFKLWLDAFNSGDTAKVSAFWHEYGGGNVPDDRVQGDARLREMTGGMRIQKIEEDTGTHLVVLMKEERGSYSESTLDLASANPPIIAHLSGHPVPAPENASDAAADDAELAAKVQKHVAVMRGGDAFSGAILIAHHDALVLDDAWGMADSTQQIKNTSDTQFCIGSMDKMFTAVAVLQLVEQGKVALDSPMVAYLPDYPNHSLAERVTIRELLSHTGGTGDIFTPEYAAHRADTRALADYVKLFGNRPAQFEPGTRMEYSNYGFILLGRIVEVVSGEPYNDYVREHIFLPAGMLHTDFRPGSDAIAGRATGYTRGPEGLIANTATLPWSGTSAGGGYSTVRDLLLFAEVLQSGKLLDAALLAEATQENAVHPGYGLGFYVLGDGAYGHGGGAPGINGELHILTRSGYIIVALANRDPRMATDLVDFITSILPEAGRVS